MEGKYSKKDVLSFLREVSIASLAVAMDNKPMSSVILFAVDDDFTFYFATHDDSFKAQAIYKNPQVSLSIWDFGKMLVQIDTQAQKIVDSDEVSITLDKIASSAAGLKNFWPPILQVEGDEYAVFKLSPDWIRILDLSDSNIKSKRMLFQHLVIKE